MDDLAEIPGGLEREAEPSFGARAPYPRVAAPATGPGLVTQHVRSLFKEPLAVSSLEMNPWLLLVVCWQEAGPLPPCSRQMAKASPCQACF